jgi:hypothetical protein
VIDLVKFSGPYMNYGARRNDQRGRPFVIRRGQLPTVAPLAAILKLRNAVPPALFVRRRAGFTHKCRKEGNNLNRLAEAHVIADYDAASKSITLEKELDTFTLVWT